MLQRSILRSRDRNGQFIPCTLDISLRRVMLSNPSISPLSTFYSDSNNLERPSSSVSWTRKLCFDIVGTEVEGKAEANFRYIGVGVE